MAFRDIVADIAAERKRQDAKWGEQNHTPPQWVSVLVEEVGEVAQVTNFTFEYKRECPMDVVKYRQELIQVAAVAVAAIECLERQETENDK